MSKYELAKYDEFYAEDSGRGDFLRVAMLLSAAGAFVASEWMLGLTALLLALITGHGIPREVANFRPGIGGGR